jgi:hypothetical protein
MTPDERENGIDRRVTPRPPRLWERVRDNVRHLQNRMAREGERLRVNRSLGRRVSRQVIGPDDGLILEPGDLVTPSAVDRARRSGVLEVLLDAVDDEADDPTR